MPQKFSTVLVNKSGVLQPATRPQDSEGHLTCSCLLREAACRPLSEARGIRLLANSSWKSDPLTAASARPLLPAAARGRSGTMAEADTTSLESAARAPPPPSASPKAGQLGRAQPSSMRLGMGPVTCASNFLLRLQPWPLADTMPLQIGVVPAASVLDYQYRKLQNCAVMHTTAGLHTECHMRDGHTCPLPFRQVLQQLSVRAERFWHAPPHQIQQHQIPASRLAFLHGLAQPLHQHLHTA